MLLSAIVILPFAAALLIPVIARAGAGASLCLGGLSTVMALVALLAQAPLVFQDGLVVERHAWVPKAGLDLAFFVDPLGLLMAGLILVIGLLVMIYARFYFGPKEAFGRFMARLALFQGSMLGIVIADNLLLLVIFWEMTSLSSFLLIGYWSHRADSRRGARNALVITSAGGLALLASALLIGHVAGTFQLTTILGQPDVVAQSALYLPILILVLFGCFTKSAQLPFQFWLPGAMAAPTPVSAYLHSATMVKAGLFLMARLWPILAGSEAWFLIVTTVGLLTMVVGAWIAIFKTDLKAILAYSTVSHLGMIAMLLGLGTKLAAVAAIFHLLNHALFKAALFLSAGIVEHETGTRDINRLGGLWRAMPITATLSTLAALAMAGVPLLNGFLSKEMMLEAAVHADYLGVAWLVPLLATVGSAFSVLYAFRFVGRVFFMGSGRPPGELAHDPGPGLWLPVACLIIPVVAIGVMPGLVAQDLVAQAGSAIIGEDPPVFELAIWHGWTQAFQLTLVAMVAGLLGLWVLRWLERLHAGLWHPSGEQIFGKLLDAGSCVVAWLTGRLQNGSLQFYLAVFCLTGLALGITAFWGGDLSAGTRPLMPLSPLGIIGWLVVLAASGFAVVAHQNRLLALIAAGLAGLMVALAFVAFSAPDLALTQLSVEVVTVVLLLLALNYLPKTTPRLRPLRRFGVNAPIALLAGAGVGAALYALLRRDVNSISAFYTAMALPAGGGANVVNVILVDFRGYDTLGEITVLAIAALVIYSLLQSALRGAAARRLTEWPSSAQAGDSHPLLLVVLTRLLLPMALLVGLYIFLRGHQAPGGGFIAGLIVGIALILQYMASGYAWASRRLPTDYHGLVAVGVLVALLTGSVAMLVGRPFLTGGFMHLHLPYLGSIELASATAFDLGVFLTVVGVVLLVLAGLSRMARLAEPSGETGPLTIALDRGENQPHRRTEDVGHAPIFGSSFARDAADPTAKEPD
ncbi:multisubunit potassium/proton antiporter, PhaA subunit /multisubunit potassium/proton antiporter, PhaB subunit [Arboricoccus pini]|uniref:Multisubunit potassium/proton antiporter, PhaA subunit /multisubunit potassium/proton antiporter, PhaB subunit n=1 Tax=Arboricoccus pini TaxID=1963835 RepID=A0A212Q2M8_9PROT|nr:monovalent cation/H+ antiporter subunit A [Arboricoccus pini]SNB53605.1 multisubunit potassium/proton antiporter, PhaA subunit /multisubunit potassium/proton antiporter, PhaB subunit [Arboricoccus pini]